MALTAKQRAFVNEYIACHYNGSEAMRRVSPKSKRPDALAYEYLRKPEIQEEIRRRFAEQAMPADEVLARLAAHARANVRDFFEFGEDGKVTGLNLVYDAPWHLVKSITPTAAGTKLELHDAQAAVVHIGKAQGVFKDDPLVNLNVTPEQLAEMSDDELDALYTKLNSITRRR